MSTKRTARNLGKSANNAVADGRWMFSEGVLDSASIFHTVYAARDRTREPSAHAGQHGKVRFSMAGNRRESV